MSIFLLSENIDSKARHPVESELLATIPGLIEVSTLSALFDGTSDQGAADPLIVLMVAAIVDQRYFDRVVEIAAQYRHQAFVVLISDEIAASEYKRLLRTGGADWVSTKAGVREVTDIIARRRLAQTSDASASRLGASQDPTTISFVPSAGGVGNTTLAIESALRLQIGRQSLRRRICILDLDFQTSHVCDYLDCEPRLQIDEFSNAPERLDEHLFEIFTSHHGSGIDVFASKRAKFSSGDLNIHALDALFDMILKRYDLVFIDHPVSWFQWTAQVIAASDGVIITGINSIPCLRQISETLALIRSASKPTGQIGIVLNRCERTFVGSIAHRQHVNRVLQDEQVFFISRRTEALESINMGVPMMLGASANKLQKEFAPLADFCGEVKSRRQVPG